MNPKIELKSVKHTYTLEERYALGGELARALSGYRGIETEFDQIKASYKSKLAESTAKIEKLQTDRVNGFEMRVERCVVSYRPKDRKKDFRLESAPTTQDEIVLTEDMTQGDFQAELILAEARFDKRAEIQLFQPDYGKIIVGTFQGKWFSAARIKVGARTLEERLDGEQRAHKDRHDAVRTAAKRATAWLSDSLGKDLAKGFEDGIQNAVNGEIGKDE